MNNYITLYGEPLEYPHQVSVDKRGVAYYGFNMATERVSGIKDITQVIVEEGTPAFESLTAIDQVKDLLDCKLLVTGRIRTRNIKRKNTDRRAEEKEHDKKEHDEKNQAAEKEHSKLYISVRAQEITDQEYEGDTNGVVLTGFVCKKGDMRTTPRGIRITDMILACWREDDESNVSDYIPAITWNGTAARAAENLNVGDCIEVRGRLQSREYTKELEHVETEVRTCYELSIEEYQVVAPAELKKEA